MTKAELIERTIDRITDPWTESCEMYEDAELIELDVAKDILAQCREEDLDMDEEDRLPAEVTAEIMLEAYNCNVRKNKHDLRIQRLAEWLTYNESVCLHDNYYDEYPNDDPCVVPVDFLDDSENSFFFDEDMGILDIIDVARNSLHTFNSAEEYCWYNDKEHRLYSSNTPFADGVIDANAMARYFIDDAKKEDLLYLLGDMDDDDVQYVFGCTREEYINE